MKKLMIVAAVALAAFASQAGLVAWNVSKVHQGDTYLTKGSIYVFFAGSAADAQTEITAIKKLANAGATEVSSAMDDANWSGTKKATAAGDFSMGSTAAKGSQTVPSNSDLGLAGDTRYYAYAVIFDTESITDNSKFLIAQSTTATVNGQLTKGDDSSQTQTFGIGSQDTNTTWYDVKPVPEPFSGTLALLGMGAIALRRKMKKAKKA